MKPCGYCGRANEVEAVHCRECGTEFPTMPTLDAASMDDIEVMAEPADGMLTSLIRKMIKAPLDGKIAM